MIALCSGPGWPSLDTLWGRLLLVWTPESFNDYLALHPNLEGALCFVSSVDGNSGDSGGKTVTDPAGVFIQTYDSLSWTSPVKASELRSFTTRVSAGFSWIQKQCAGLYLFMCSPRLHCLHACCIWLCLLMMWAYQQSSTSWRNCLCVWHSRQPRKRSAMVH